MKIFKKSGADMLKQRFIAKLRKLALCFVVFCSFFLKKMEKNSMERDHRSLLCLHTAARQGFAAVFCEHLSKTHLEFPVRDLAAARRSAV